MNRSEFFDLFYAQTFDRTRACDNCKKRVDKYLMCYKVYNDVKEICKECFCDYSKSYKLFFSTYYIDRWDKENNIVSKKEVFEKSKSYHDYGMMCSTCWTVQKYLMTIEDHNYNNYHICEKCFVGENNE